MVYQSMLGGCETTTDAPDVSETTEGSAADDMHTGASNTGDGVDTPEEGDCTVRGEFVFFDSEGEIDDAELETQIFAELFCRRLEEADEGPTFQEKLSVDQDTGRFEQVIPWRSECMVHLVSLVKQEGQTEAAGVRNYGFVVEQGEVVLEFQDPIGAAVVLDRVEIESGGEVVVVEAPSLEVSVDPDKADFGKEKRAPVGGIRVPPRFWPGTQAFGGFGEPVAVWAFYADTLQASAADGLSLAFSDDLGDGTSGELRTYVQRLDGMRRFEDAGAWEREGQSIPRLSWIAVVEAGADRLSGRADAQRVVRDRADAEI
ncbi:MAG: hypothetical protein V3V08_19195 [Nannocystaceae bacterium]